MVSPAAAEFLACRTVAHGAVKLPAFASEPPGVTKKILPERTVKGMPLLAPTPATFTTIFPVTAELPTWKLILLSDHKRYAAGAAPPIVSVELPLAEPKPNPKTVTMAP